MLMQMLANMNLNFENPVHLTVFLVGWTTVLVWFCASFCMVRFPAYRSIWFGVVSFLFVVLDFWLFSLPPAKGLFH